MNTPLWLAEDVVLALRGSCLHEQTWKAFGISIDSRTVAQGDLFIALQGPSHDGHDHVAAAFAAGASAAIVSRQPTQVTPEAPLIFVEDTMAALQELGRAGRARAKGKIIAVTGSVGKTSTKEMLRVCLSSVGKTYANQGSFNNHWGVPLSLASLPADAEYGIFEMGMNHAGELTPLSALVRPDFAIITTIEAVHLEFFASTEKIAEAKAEIFQGMTPSGIVILNRDNRHFSQLATAAKNKGIKKIMSFASEGKGDAYLIDCALTAEGSAINAVVMGTKVHYALGTPGMHLVQNSLAVLLTATLASGNLDECAIALARYKPPQGRGVTNSVTLDNGDIITLIDESYNASPASVCAAIRVLATINPRQQGRRILVLGDMLELGPTSPTLHRDLAPVIVKAKIDSVFCCGEMMRYLFDALPPELQGGHTADSMSLAPMVLSALHADDVITIKGSNGMKLKYIISALTAQTAPSEHKIAS